MSEVTKPIMLDETGVLIAQKLSEVAASNKAYEALLNTKADKTDLASPFVFKGNVEYAALPTSGNEINDTYYCTDKMCRYTWNGAEWFPSSLSEVEYMDALNKVAADAEAQVSQLSSEIVEISEWKNYKIADLETKEKVIIGVEVSDNPFYSCSTPIFVRANTRVKGSTYTDNADVKPLVKCDSNGNITNALVSGVYRGICDFDYVAETDMYIMLCLRTYSELEGYAFMYHDTLKSVLDIQNDINILENNVQYYNLIDIGKVYLNSSFVGQNTPNVTGEIVSGTSTIVIAPTVPSSKYYFTQLSNVFYNIVLLDNNMTFISSLFAYQGNTGNWNSEVELPNNCYNVGFVLADAYKETAYFGKKESYDIWKEGIYKAGLAEFINANKNNYNKNHRLITTLANMSSGSEMSLEVTDIKQNNTFSFNAKLDGAFSSVYLAHGKSAMYSGMFVVVDSTNVYFYRYHSSDILVATHPHGLTIEDFISVTIHVLQDQSADVIVSTIGGQFKANNKWQGSRGTVSCGVNGCNLKECILSFYCSDYDKKLWAFGDSYFYDYESDRWPKIVIDNGFVGAMFDGYGGRTASGGLSSLKKCLEFGTPKQILWCLGMNNWDSSTSVNEEWNDVFEELKTLCKGKNIELILCTIPTTSTANHEYKNAIIKASGYRYVDVANALGADGTGTWYDGLLSDDDIHTTGRGSKVIASRMMVDVPELLG